MNSPNSWGDRRKPGHRTLADDSAAIEYTPLLPYQRKMQAHWSKKMRRDPCFNDSLDEIERMSLYIIGKIGLKFGFKHSTLYADDTNGMWLIFQSICSAIAEALPEVDIYELPLVTKQRDALSDDEAEEAAGDEA
jgi:hypothetical protein